MCSFNACTLEIKSEALFQSISIRRCVVAHASDFFSVSWSCRVNEPAFLRTSFPGPSLFDLSHTFNICKMMKVSLLLEICAWACMIQIYMNSFSAHFHSYFIIKSGYENSWSLRLGGSPHFINKKNQHKQTLYGFSDQVYNDFAVGISYTWLVQAMINTFRCLEMKTFA